MVTKLLLYAADKKDNREIPAYILSGICSYAFKYVWQCGYFFIKELFLSSTCADRVQAEAKIKLLKT